MARRPRVFLSGCICSAMLRTRGGCLQRAAREHGQAPRWCPSVQRWTLAPKVLGGMRAKLGHTHPYLTQQPPEGPHTLTKRVHMLGVFPDTLKFSAAPSVARTTPHVCHAAPGRCTQVCTSTKRSLAQTPPSGWVPGYSLTPKR